MGKNYKANKIRREKEREEKLRKKKDARIQHYINIVVVLAVLIGSCVGYYFRHKAMETTGITTCKILKKYWHGGTRPKLHVDVEFYIDGKRYESTGFYNRESGAAVGDCFLLEYSVEKPGTYIDILWDKGKQDCGDSETDIR